MESPIYSGFFTSTGQSQKISFRPGFNWMWVYNYTAFPAASNLPTSFYWQLGMPDQGGLSWVNAGGVQTTVLLAGNGFTYVDDSIVTATPALGNALTAISAANPPVVSSVVVPLIGQIVRFFSLTSAAGVGLGQKQIEGVDFTVTAVTNNSFSIGNINLLNSTASTAGFWKLISSDPEFYPRQRVISWITATGLGATSPVPVGMTRIYTTVTHGSQVGQKINIQMPGGPRVWGNFFALNNVVVTITKINSPRNGGIAEPNNGWVAAGIGLDNNFDVAFDSTGFGAWDTFTHNAPGGTQSYLGNINFPQGPALCIPFGEDTSFVIGLNPPLPFPAVQTANVLGDSLDNTATLSLILGGGNLTPAAAAGPAGALGDIIYWQGGASFDAFPKVISQTSP
jgi:hypothetical protein